jgi:nuclear pore complex protein Nup133
VSHLTFFLGQSGDDPFQAFRPSEALGVYTDGLDRRFNDMEKAFRDKLVEAMKAEDSTLRKYVEKHRLEQWARTTAETAEATVTELVDEATKSGAETNSEAAEMDGVKTNGKSH